ncbi:Kallikrein-4 [Heterocephalus glaber]|uniref:Kallikrein-4 n=1 Tax=Heterocephalus glaber TaxID=10181 RepID=G5BRA3_HETGA|nr:Kallikrein-4 [Heterocephalus glaber]
MVTAGNPWGWLLGYLVLGVTGSRIAGSPSSAGERRTGGGCADQPGRSPHLPTALSSYSVGLGLHNLGTSHEPGSRVLEPLLSIRHPEYDNPAFANDLMLIKLKEAVPESSTIRSISVASRCPVEGDACLVSGWGRLANGGLPSRLQCVNISVAPQEVCSEVYDSVYHYSMFCAGGGPNRRDSCHGDSGGPLVCNRSLQGLVSLGHIPCGQPGSPSVYTNLCKFTDWIQQTMHTS